MSSYTNIRKIFVIISVSTLATFIYSFIAYFFTTNNFSLSLDEIWHHWDTVHYLEIARTGYVGYGEKTYLIAFFPLYPFLVKIFTVLTSGNYLISALLVSNLAYVAAVIYLYKLARLDYPPDIALRTVVYFSVFPTAYFLHAGYTESLFISLTLASFYYARKERWYLSGLTGMLSAATRIAGVVLPVALLIEYMNQKKFSVKNINKNEIIKVLICLSLISSGFALYLAINFITFGDPLQFLGIQQENWHKSLSSPLTGFTIALNTLLNAEMYNSLMVGLSELVFGVGTIILAFWSFFQLRISYSVYTIIMCLIITSTSFWLSIPRYSLTIFPIFIAMALFGKNSKAKYVISAFSLILFFLYLSLFVQGKWAF